MEKQSRAFEHPAPTVKTRRELTGLSSEPRSALDRVASADVGLCSAWS